MSTWNPTKWLTVLLISLLATSTALSPAVAGNRQGPDLDLVQKHIFQKQVSQADFDVVQQALRTNPNSHNAHRLLGDCYSVSGFLELAEKEYMISLGKDPNKDELLIARINKALKNEGLLAAEQQLRNTQEKMPGSPAIVVLRVQLMLERDNDWGASHVCDVWQRIRGNVFGLSTARAMIHFHHKAYKAALKEMNKDLSKRPEFGPALVLKARLQSAIGQS
jgi:tetratricopeptide (TPR) repeat protein